MKATIVIPNINGKGWLKDSIESVYAQTEQDFELIIVDNGSTDESLEQARSYCGRPNFTLIENGTNTGFSHAVNQGIARAKGEPVRRDKSECLVDLRVDAFIPEKYIADGPGRIEAYKRIAAIQTAEDAADVLDELIDRYGDPPPSVSDLVNVSLARVQATAVGVYEVTQKKDTLVLQVEQLDLRMIQGLLVAFNGRVVTGAGAKPYLSVTLQKEEKPLELLQSILRAMQDILKD